MSQLRRALYFVGNSIDVLKALPRSVQHGLGTALRLAQEGNKDPNAKPLKGFGGASVLEVVEDFDGNTYRAVYTVRLRSGRLRAALLSEKEQERHSDVETRSGPDSAPAQAGDRTRQGIGAMKIKKAKDNIFAELGFE